jgi:hypothetical protein|tara:strand:+ start:298 stop:591 length:294 start_codon:yes stop_codon:yes gene_type:complete
MIINKKQFPHKNPLYNLQVLEHSNGKYEAHIVVGSNRNGGGYNFDMNLPKVYNEMMSKWAKAGVKVNKCYIRHPKGLTFNTLDDAMVIGNSLLSKLQ